MRNHINPSDTQRAIRAYEIKFYTKKSMYDWFKKTKSNYEKKSFFKICLDYPRDQLLERISDRGIKMIKKFRVLQKN